MNKTFAFAALTAAALIAAPASASVNLVTNGGFETVAGSQSASNFTLGFSPNATLGSWSSASSGYNLLFHSPIANSSSALSPYPGGQEFLQASTASPTGGNFVVLDGDVNVRGALSQTINGLTVGMGYLLTFDWGAGQLASRTGATTEQLQVSFGGQTYLTPILNNASAGFSGWNSAAFNFTATSTSQVLSFLSLGTPSGLPPVALLDSVSVQAVPEPATWAMMLLGFGMVGAATRYRRRKTTVAFA